MTFTRKAAAELRGRFQIQLEGRLRHEELGQPAPSPEGRVRVDDALRHLERLFAGTIHSFCAQLLRERPVEAGIAPGFREMDDVEDALHRARGWRDFLDRKRSQGSDALHELEEAGVQPVHLEGELGRVCAFPDVTFPEGSATRPDTGPARAAIERLAKAVERMLAGLETRGSTCPTQKSARRFLSLLRVGRGRPTDIAQLLEIWARPPKIVPKWWGDDKEAREAAKDELEALLDSFRETTAEPWLGQWKAYLYRHAIGLLTEARLTLAASRRQTGTLNYSDLLELAARLLRDHRSVRRRLAGKYRWLFVDEFQDTNPLQAEVILLLADPEGPDRWRETHPRPGSLFVVGDPKQSIFRFSEADIQIYDEVRGIIARAGGEVVELTTSFRALPALCDWANRVFATEGFFPAKATNEQATFRRLDADPQRQPPTNAACGIQVLRHLAKKRVDVVESDAAAIAAIIVDGVDAGRYRYRDFLVLTRKREHLPRYAAALDRLHVPYAVSGSVAFKSSRPVATIVTLLRALADPDDGVAVVGVLRGPFFGISDPELYRWRTERHTFLYTLPLADDIEGTVPNALRCLAGWHRLTRDKPLAAAIEQILGASGMIASAAAATPGGADAGDLLHAVARLRLVAEEGGTIAEAADLLSEDIEGNEIESIPLEPGLDDVVRVMNLHRAKGLEAPVVFLADPVSGVQPRVDIHVDRSGPTPFGYLKLVKEIGDHGKQVIGQPLDWPTHEAIESRFLDAEEKRLLYVAGTRARDLLVVSEAPNAKPRNPPWGPFDPFLHDVGTATVPNSVEARAPAARDLSPDIQHAHAAARVSNFESALTPTWRVESVTATTHHATPYGTPATPGRTREPDSGVAWGKLVHALLEHAMRRGAPDSLNIERLARWLTVDDRKLQEVIPEALQTVRGVMASAFWREAMSAKERLPEVPFAILETSGTDLRVLQGIVDIAYRTQDGWHIVDYKTDLVPEGGAQALLARYAGQAEAYAQSWRRMTDGARVIWALYLVRPGRLVGP